MTGLRRAPSPPSASRGTSSGGGATRSARPVARTPLARTPTTILCRRAFLGPEGSAFGLPSRKEKSAGRCRRFFEAQDAAGSAVLEFAAKRTASRNHLGAPRTRSPPSGHIRAPVVEHALAVPRAASTDVLRARAAVNPCLPLRTLVTSGLGSPISACAAEYQITTVRRVHWNRKGKLILFFLCGTRTAPWTPLCLPWRRL